MVLHPLLEVAFDLAHVPLEDGERGVVIVDGSHGAVAELREIEHGRVEVAGLGELPAPRHDFAGDGLEVAELLDLECAGVSAADGVVADLHAFACGSEGFKLPSEVADVRHESVEEVEGLRQHTSTHGHAAVGCLLGAEDGVFVWKQPRPCKGLELFTDLFVLGVEVALVAEDGLSGDGVLYGKGGGFDSVSSVVEGDLRVIDHIAGAAAGGDFVGAWLFVGRVVCPLPVVIDVGPELVDEILVGGEERVLFEKGVRRVERGAGLRVDTHTARGEGSGLGSEDTLGKGEDVASGGCSSADR